MILALPDKRLRGFKYWMIPLTLPSPVPPWGTRVLWN